MAVKICPECGGKVAMSKNVCIHCGHEFKDTKKCPECDAEVDANVKTCPECGHDFVDNASPAVVASQNSSQPNQTNVQKNANAIVCKQCGSGDTTKVDDYTYKCNMCGTIISLPRPDTNITNINSFVGSVDDVPVFQVKQNLTEKEFVRKTVLELAKKGNVSAKFLESYRASAEAVKKAYITFAEVPYSVDVSYSCQIGTDYTVTYGDGKKKTETKWESFSGNGSDGGIAFMCTYGTETKIEFVTPIYFKSEKDEYIPFQEEQVYPLKRRVDRSVQESEKKTRIDDLARKCKSELPGHKVDGWRYTGRCNFDPIDTFYYVPSFNLEGTSNGHSVIFAAPAIEHGHIFTYFPEGEAIVNEGGKTQPTKKTAKVEFKQHKAMFILTLIALIIGFVVAGVSIVLASALGNFLILIALPIGLGTGISMCVIRPIIIKKFLNNQTLAFKNEKAEACVKCLEENQLEPLTAEEKSSIDASLMSKKEIKDKVNVIVASVLLGTSILSLVLTAIPYGRTSGGSNSGDHGDTYVPKENIKFGLYPQTRVSDPSLILELESLSSSSVNSQGYYSYNEELYYPYTAKPYSDDYKFEDGSWIDSDINYWFKVEPIEWKVLDDNNEYFITSAMLLDTHRYNENYSRPTSMTDYQGNTGEAYANNYKYSEIRSWLNTDFYDMAFFSENSRIKVTTVDNSASTTYSSSNEYACENTNDKVFLLSYQDLENSSYGFNSYDSRKCKPTDFALARGAYYSSSYDAGYYWTRSPHDDYSHNAYYVGYGGGLYGNDVNFSNRGVRPALKISL